MGMSSKQVSSDHLELNWSPNMLTSSEPIQSSNPASRPTNMKRSSSLQTQPQPDTLKCPRCDSSNTKFCYYNNYNKTQPRHYCKACKRHWTKGGTLRNVPVGGGRKNKRVKRPATTTTTTATTIDHNLGFSDQKYMFPDDNNNNKSKGYNNLLFNKPNITSDQFDQVSWDFNGGFSSAMQQQQQSSSSATAVHQNLGFSILSSMDDDTNTIIPVIPASTTYSPLLSGFKDDSTTVTTRMMMPNISQPWMQQVPSHPRNNLLEPSTFWTWNDIDYMVQGDMNKPFEDPHMKH